MERHAVHRQIGERLQRYVHMVLSLEDRQLVFRSHDVLKVQLASRTIHQQEFCMRELCYKRLPRHLPIGNCSSQARCFFEPPRYFSTIWRCDFQAAALCAVADTQLPVVRLPAQSHSLA